MLPANFKKLYGLQTETILARIWEKGYKRNYMKFFDENKEGFTFVSRETWKKHVQEIPLSEWKVQDMVNAAALGLLNK